LELIRKNQALGIDYFRLSLKRSWAGTRDVQKLQLCARS
jgi:hypothetical protein